VKRRTFLKGAVALAGAGCVSTESQKPGAHARDNGSETVSKTVTIQRSIPVRHDVDVFVAGGGPAGAAAAVAAARQGRSVFLVERQNCLGGMGTTGLVPAFMQFTDGENFLAGGVGQEILTKLQEAGGAYPEDGTAIRAEVLKRVYDDLLVDAGVDFTFETQLVDIETDGDCVALAILAAKSGLFAVRAKMFVDGTGDGDIAAWAGAPFEKGDEEGNLMPGTLCSLWSQIDWDKYFASGVGVQRAMLPKAFEDGVFTHKDRHLPGIWRVGEHLGGGNIGHTFGVDATDERSVTEAMLWGRKLVLEYERYYKEYLQGFENMELMTLGSALGIRETRRIMGDYVLQLDDFNSRAVFEDEVGRYSYPVDIHASKPSDENYAKFEKEFYSLRYGKGESYGVPYRILCPKKLSNVLVAGRCVSSDRFLQGSIRVMPGCYITGQAAGTAASIAVEQNTDTRGFKVAELQARLKAMGGYLPNFAG
jgi:FAD dependent oxidoreductase